MSEWHPIDTAPKDGTWILLAGGELNEQHPDDTTSRPVVARWKTLEEGEMIGWFVADFDDGYGLGIFYEDPTHWASIPQVVE
jgi:hypothetical protein